MMDTIFRMLILDMGTLWQFFEMVMVVFIIVALWYFGRIVLLPTQ
jgi:hypothetical protein